MEDIWAVKVEWVVVEVIWVAGVSWAEVAASSDAMEARWVATKATWAVEARLAVMAA